MIAPDVNLLVYAYRADMAEHDGAARWLAGIVNSGKRLALSNLVVAGYLRIVTNPRVFAEPTPLALAWQHVNELRSAPTCRVVGPGPRHVDLLRELCETTGATGALVGDAAHAAVAIERDLTWATADRDFSRFVGLDVVYPLELQD